MSFKDLFTTVGSPVHAMKDPDAPPTVTYFAVSIFQSKTFWFNTITFLVAVLSATDVVPIVPKAYLPLSTALVAIGNLWLRTLTVRPVALIAPGEVKPIDVPRIGPPPVPVLTD